MIDKPINLDAVEERGISVEKFNKLSKRDFENGAVLDEIYKSLKDKECLIYELQEAREEIDNLKGKYELAKVALLKLEEPPETYTRT